MTDGLIQRWHRLARDLRLQDPADAIGEELIARYREPHRRFHGPAHLKQVVDLLDEQHADARLQLAAWFHDAVWRFRPMGVHRSGPWETTIPDHASPAFRSM